MLIAQLFVRILLLNAEPHKVGRRASYARNCIATFTNDVTTTGRAGVEEDEFVDGEQGRRPRREFAFRDTHSFASGTRQIRHDKGAGHDSMDRWIRTW